MGSVLTQGQATQPNFLLGFKNVGLQISAFGLLPLYGFK
jgi:hypothetical protein